MTAEDQVDEDENFDTFPSQKQEGFISCLCVVVNDFTTSANLSQDGTMSQMTRGAALYQTKKAYCFMFSHQHYQFMLDAIKALLTCQKYERLTLVQSLYSVMNEIKHQEVVDILSYTFLQVSITSNAFHS